MVLLWDASRPTWILRPASLQTGAASQIHWNCGTKIFHVLQTSLLKNYCSIIFPRKPAKNKQIVHVKSLPETWMNHRCGNSTACKRMNLGTQNRARPEGGLKWTNGCALGKVGSLAADFVCSCHKDFAHSLKLAAEPLRPHPTLCC